MSRYRLQGSIIGSYTNPTSTSASGVYDVSAASKYTSANLWAGTTPISTTPTSNVSLVANSTGATYTTTSDNYGVFTFTGSGTFTPAISGNVELMMIGGGGGGGGTSSEPGASSGGVVFYSSQEYRFSSGTALTLTAGTTYTVTIGAGGSGGSGSGSNGVNTTLVGGSINLTAYGGGRPNGTGAATAQARQSPGAGASYYGFAWGATGAAAPNQGYGGTWAGQNAVYGGGSNVYFWYSGGGGLGGPGNCGAIFSADYIPDSSKGQGGQGIYTDISGTYAYYGSGGNGGINSYTSNNVSGAAAPLGGGGTCGGYNNSGVGTAATANTGSGGAGASSGLSLAPGTSGGSGICIIRYPLVNAVFSTDPSYTGTTNVNATGGTIVNYGSYKIHTFTATGSFIPAVAGAIEILMVGAGGGAPSIHNGNYPSNFAGAGGGGIVYYGSESNTGIFTRSGTVINVAAGVTYTATIGAGGAAGAAVTLAQYNAGPFPIVNVGGNGSATTFIGGAISLSASGGSAAASNNQYGGTSGTGFTGGMFGADPNYSSGGGGGGAGQRGGTQGYGSLIAALGGHGVPFAISGTSKFYGGGGGGGCYSNSNNISFGNGSRGNGGAGGGGDGKINGSGAASAGTANTGGGAGGTAYGGGGTYTAYAPGVSGGSGVIIIRYLST